MGKFEDAFKRTNDKMAGDTKIDFSKSDINKKRIPRKNKIQTHLSDDEFEAFKNTFKPLEQRADRVRNLILNDIKQRIVDS